MKISIITVNFNNYLGLLKTFISLKNFSKNKIEHWVIDGYSKDMLLSFKSLLNIFDFKYISESDLGIYNAMNKGIRNSSTEYLLFLNSGDSISDSFNIFNIESNLGEYDLIYGDIIDHGQNSPQIVSYPSKLTLDFMICGGLPHQATLIRRSLFHQVGLYNENYKIISDWVFFMESLFFYNASYKHIPFVLSNFEGGGLSSNSLYTKDIIIEQLDYLNKRFPNSIKIYLCNSPYVKKYLRQKPRLIRWFYKFYLYYFNKLI